MLGLFGRPETEQQRRNELLSAYVDGQLSERERKQLEARLKEDAALRAELRALHQTVSLVRELPQAAAPRNFILSKSMVQRRRPAPAPEPRRVWVAPVLTAATAIVSLLFVVVLVGDLLLSGVGGPAAAPEAVLEREKAPQVALEAASTRQVERETVPSPTAPMVDAEAPAEEPELAAEEKERDTAETARAAEEFAGTGATPVPGVAGGLTDDATAAPAPTVAPTVTSVLVLTPAIPAEAPVVSEGELGLVEPTPRELQVTPEAIREAERGWQRARPGQLPLRALEIVLGLTVVALTFTTLRAWQNRRR
ncbi:MAG: zf-HC2 domain-containing protein [Gemmatimonadales bacterium]|jgi:hypothetical protein